MKLRKFVYSSLAVLAGFILEASKENLRAQEFPIAIGADNHLAYIADERGNRIPDFSHCGYAGGDRPIPSPPVRVFVEPAEGDDGARIQAAIAYVATLPMEESGFRGSILLLAGEYQVEGDLRIPASGVVLRGSNSSQSKTTILATGTGRRPLVRIGRQSARAPSEDIGKPTSIADRYVPVGAMRLRVENAETFEVGDRVLVTRPSTDAWIAALGTRAPGVGWRAGRCDIYWDRTILSIEGDEIAFDAPITTAIETRYGGGSVAKYSPARRINNVGMEDLTLRSSFDESRPNDEEHSWFGVVANNAENLWIRRVRFEHFSGGAVLLREATKWATVEDCLSLDPISEIGGYRRHSFFTQGGLTLFLRCYAENGRHDFAVGHCAAGPNAFVNCYANNARADSGPLESWASGVLYDNVRIDGNELNLVNRWTQPPGAGWSAANCVLWQCQASVIRAFRPPAAHNWVLGYWAEPNGDASFMGQSEFVRPLSLYRAQIEDRLGKQRAESVGPFLLEPMESTSPTIEEAARFVAGSDRPKRMLRDVIEKRMAMAPARSSNDAPSVEQILTNKRSREEPTKSREIKIQNGWLTIDGRVLTGGHVNPTWWRGTIRPSDAEQFGPAITRFAPGRYGVGLTDELAAVARKMVERGEIIYDHHYGLWYDRRRDDHLMVRRADGKVAPPSFEQPFARNGKGAAWDGLSKYDLTKFNPWYWRRLNEFAGLCDEHGLVLFHQHFFQHNLLEAGAHWADCPWRPENNVNDVDLPEPPPYVGDKRIFLAHEFYSPNNKRLRELQAGYLRQCLDSTAGRSNVVHSISAEYTGPLEFTQFWIDTIRRWKADTGQECLVALAATKGVQDALLDDPNRSSSVDVIDIRYWCYDREGNLYAPAGGVDLAPRQHVRQMKPKAADFSSVARAVREYRLRYPDKPVTYFADMYCPSPRDGWAVLMGGGSLANVPSLPAKLAVAIPKMAPVDGEEGILMLSEPGKEYLIYAMEPLESMKLRLPSNGKYQVTQIDARTGRPIHSKRLVSDGETIDIEQRVIWLSHSTP